MVESRRLPSGQSLPGRTPTLMTLPWTGRGGMSEMTVVSAPTRHTNAVSVGGTTCAGASEGRKAATPSHSTPA